MIPAPLFPDARDATKAPPAMLDPIMVLKARRWMMTSDGFEELKAKRERKEQWEAK
jgi:hypothetical protein